MALLMKLTRDPDVNIIGCHRCDTALLPQTELKPGEQATLYCPLCGARQPVQVVEVGGEEVLPYNPLVQEEDAQDSPVYTVNGITGDEDLVLLEIPGLLDDPAFYGLQDGVAPMVAFGWVGGEGLLGEPGYSLILVVRVADMPGQDLFRVRIPAELLPSLSTLTDDLTFVLVSGKKGVFFPEGAEVYLEAVAKAGALPGAKVSLASFVELEA